MVRLGIGQADRREATARRIQEIENLLARLDAVLAAATGPGPPDDEADVLRGACRVLAGLVGRTAGADVLVSAGPDHGRAVRLRNRDGELTAELVSGSDDAHPSGVTTEVIGTRRTTATAIASLLWSGGIGDGTVPPPDGSQEGQ
jgi:hypothetical protein